MKELKDSAGNPVACHEVPAGPGHEESAMVKVSGSLTEKKRTRRTKAGGEPAKAGTTSAEEKPKTVD